MSCTNYNSNTAPSVTFGGSVPNDSCFSDVPTLFTLFKNSLVGSMPADYSTFLISDTEPSPSNRDKVWVYVDSATCRPIGIRLYLNGKWVDIGARYFYGNDTSSVANTITVTSTTPSVNWAETGQIYAIKANQANTGPVTVTIGNGTTNWYSGVAVKQYGASDLAGLEILASQVLLLYYDGTNFQLLNPRPTSGGSSVTSSSLNLSFEDDTDGNGIPDQWNAYADNLTTKTYTGSSGTDLLAAPVGGSFTLDTVTTTGGLKSAKFVCTNGAGNGGGFIQNAGWIPCVSDSIIELSWYARTTATGIDCKAEILWYSSKSDVGGYISSTTIWTDTANGPNGYWYQLGGIAKAPSSARFYRIRLIAGIMNNDIAGSVWFDDVQLNAPRFGNNITYGSTTAINWKSRATTIQVKVECVAAGSPGTYNGLYAGSGGGGGEYACSYVTVAPSTVYPLIVGRGAGPTYNTSFNTTTVLAKVSASATGATGGPGGTGGTGDITINGQAGDNSLGTLVNAAYGGCSAMGVGGYPNNSQISPPGYGGGGGSCNSSITPANGADGVIVLRYN